MTPVMTPGGGVIGSGVPTLIAPLGAASVTMGMLVLALLVAAALVILLATPRTAS